MQTLISYLHAWGIANNDVILEPLLRPHNQHYSGAIFQVHLVDEAETGVTSLVAVGMPLLTACNIFPYQPNMLCGAICESALWSNKHQTCSVSMKQRMSRTTFFALDCSFSF